MSDNGSAYESFAFRDLLVARGIRHKRTRPSTPRTNGKAERFIQTNLREWAYARPFATSADRAAGMCPWIDTNNASRPHSALGAKWPMAWIAALSAAAERMKTSPPEISDAEPRFAGAGRVKARAGTASRRLGLDADRSGTSTISQRTGPTWQRLYWTLTKQGPRRRVRHPVRWAGLVADRKGREPR
jgi:Integrase core domain